MLSCYLCVIYTSKCSSLTYVLLHRCVHLFFAYLSNSYCVLLRSKVNSLTSFRLSYSWSCYFSCRFCTSISYCLCYWRNYWSSCSRSWCIRSRYSRVCWYLCSWYYISNSRCWDSSNTSSDWVYHLYIKLFFSHTRLLDKNICYFSIWKYYSHSLCCCKWSSRFYFSKCWRLY